MISSYICRDSNHKANKIKHTKIWTTWMTFTRNMNIVNRRRNIVRPILYSIFWTFIPRYNGNVANVIFYPPERQFWRQIWPGIGDRHQLWHAGINNNDRNLISNNRTIFHYISFHFIIQLFHFRYNYSKNTS